MTKKKSVPMRTCIACREMKPKRDLIRVVRSPEGDISIDFKGKKPGRGAYVCPDEACLKKAVKSKALERAFGVAVPDEIYETMKEQMGEENGR